MWYWCGCKFWFFRRYNIKRDKMMIKSRQVLEDAMTPQLQKMLKDNKCD